MGEKEQGGMLRTIVIISLIFITSLFAFYTVGSADTSTRIGAVLNDLTQASNGIVSNEKDVPADSWVDSPDITTDVGDIGYNVGMTTTGKNVTHFSTNYDLVTSGDTRLQFMVNAGEGNMLSYLHEAITVTDENGTVLTPLTGEVVADLVSSDANFFASQSGASVALTTAFVKDRTVYYDIKGGQTYHVFQSTVVDDTNETTPKASAVIGKGVEPYFGHEDDVLKHYGNATNEAFFTDFLAQPGTTAHVTNKQIASW